MLPPSQPPGLRSTMSCLQSQMPMSDPVPPLLQTLHGSLLPSKPSLKAISHPTISPETQSCTSMSPESPCSASHITHYLPSNPTFLLGFSILSMVPPSMQGLGAFLPPPSPSLLSISEFHPCCPLHLSAPSFFLCSMGQAPAQASSSPSSPHLAFSLQSCLLQSEESFYTQSCPCPLPPLSPPMARQHPQETSKEFPDPVWPRPTYSTHFLPTPALIL